MSGNTGKVVLLTMTLIIVGVMAGLWMLARGIHIQPPENETQPATTISTNTTNATSRKMEPIDIAFEDAASPWSNPDGAGCANEIVEAAFAAAKTPIKTHVMPYARAKEMVMKGEIAGCVAMSWSPELEGKILFPDPKKPLYVCVATFVQNLQSPVKAKSADELGEGTTVGVVLNYEYPAPIRELEKRGVKFETATSEEINLRKLEAGRLDLAIINIDDLKTADLLFAKAEVAGKVGVVFEGVPQSSHIGFSIAHPRGEFARSKYNEGYAVIKSNGTLDEIRAKWRGK